MRKMELKIQVSCVSNIGEIRSNNEDNIFFDGYILKMYNNGTHNTLVKEITTKEPKCFAVFDGMGGECKGEKASFYAAETFNKECKNILLEMPEIFLLNTCFKMNDRICQEQEIDKCYMGTTAAIIYFYLGKAYICNVGDSRIYQQKQGQLIQISKDHVIEIRNEKTKPALTQNIGISEEEMKIEPYIVKCTCDSNDKFLICSDGLTDMVSEEIISEILNQDKSVKEITEELLKIALDNGGKDNTTIIVCKII